VFSGCGPETIGTSAVAVHLTTQSTKETENETLDAIFQSYDVEVNQSSDLHPRRELAHEPGIVRSPIRAVPAQGAGELRWHDQSRDSKPPRVPSSCPSWLLAFHRLVINAVSGERPEMAATSDDPPSNTHCSWLRCIDLFEEAAARWNSIYPAKVQAS